MKAYMAGELQNEMSDVSPLTMEWVSAIFMIQINI